MLVNELLGIGLHHPGVPHAQRVKTDRIFGIVLPPPAIGNLLERLENVLLILLLHDLLSPAARA